MAAPTRILIVEDEPLIAMMLEDYLESLGKELVGTADAVAPALELVAAGGIDAAILDVNLRGGERSWPIADTLAEQGVPFVFATGGSEDGIAERHRDHPTLAKPFTMDSVARALDALG